LNHRTVIPSLSSIIFEGRSEYFGSSPKLQKQSAALLVTKVYCRSPVVMISTKQNPTYDPMINSEVELVIEIARKSGWNIVGGRSIRSICRGVELGGRCHRDSNAN
jgi:hypothetical protein